MSISEVGGQDLGRYPIVPLPQHLEARADEFVLDAQTAITLSDPTNTDLRAVADLFAEMVRFSADLPLPVAKTGNARATIAFEIGRAHV